MANTVYRIKKEDRWYLEAGSFDCRDENLGKIFPTLAEAERVIRNGIKKNIKIEQARGKGGWWTNNIEKWSKAEIVEYDIVKKDKN